MSDPSRFDAFMRDNQDRVYALACRLTGRPADAQDIAQQVFLRAWQHFDQLDGNPSAPGWLRVATTRLCINHAQRYRWRWKFFSEFTPEGEDDAPSFADTLTDQDLPSAGSHREGPSEELEQALAKLPDAQRIPIVLFHFEELSYEDIARQLGVSLAKVKTDILRGRARLKAVLASASPA